MGQDTKEHVPDAARDESFPLEGGAVRQELGDTPYIAVTKTPDESELPA
jgi:hypothetical protein